MLGMNVEVGLFGHAGLFCVALIVAAAAAAATTAAVALARCWI